MRINRASVNRMTSISPVWIVPIVALIIAAWLAVKAHQDKGTMIELEFSSASDVIPGQTQIRLKDVEVGKVKKVRLSKDLKSVIVVAELEKGVSSHLSHNSRFWVVTPRISAKGVSNLGTLISGVYIVMDPGDPGKYKTKFQGLAEPPIFRSDELGTQYVLQAQELGSVDIGSPIYYRQVRVGEVTSFKLGADHNHVDINIFVRSPYDKIVQTRSRFWNVSGFGMTVGADGVKAKMASIASLIGGGVAFDNTAGFEDAMPAKEGRRFFLYDDRESVKEGRYDIKVFYRLRFNSSVRGLTVGAPVEFRGILIGEVVSVALDTSDDENHSTLVYIAMEPQRLDVNDQPTREDVDNRMEFLVKKGLRAQMKTASLLTGSKYIDFVLSDHHTSGMSEGLFVRAENFSEIPTTAGASDDIGLEISKIIDRVNTIPIETIGADLTASVASLKHFLGEIEQNNTGLKIDAVVESTTQTLEKAQVVMTQLESLIQNVDDTIAPDSQLKHSLGKMLESVSGAAESVDALMDELSRNPNALISGVKKDEK